MRSSLTRGTLSRGIGSALESSTASGRCLESPRQRERQPSHSGCVLGALGDRVVRTHLWATAPFHLPQITVSPAYLVLPYASVPISSSCQNRAQNVGWAIAGALRQVNGA